MLLFVFDTRPGGLFLVIGMDHCFRMSSNEACALGFIDFVVTRSHFLLESNKIVGSNSLIDQFFLEIRIISMYIVSESML